MARSTRWGARALRVALRGRAPAARPPRAADPAAPQEPAAEAPAAGDDLAVVDDLAFEDDGAGDDHHDPFETVNRGIFAVNDGLDVHVIEPVATAWDWVFPDFAQRALRRAFDNLRFPIVFFNDLLQWKPMRAGESVARFLLNSTVGLAGLLDPAAAIGIDRHDEDFGQTLGWWGVPAGPFLMLPLLGPSNVRDGFGLIVDSAFRAIGFFIPFWASAAMVGVDTLNRRALIREQIQAEREAAVDWYAAVRSAYTQYREALVRDRRESLSPDEVYPVFEETDEATQ
jgi:phospholipid-binding lipoprotein MlaA